jgi:arylsulfatase A-like enzyme
MQRREFMRWAGAGVAALSLPSALTAGDRNPRAGVKPPNIVFVVSDDQNPAYLSCYGGRTPTPHLDRLAEEGALFTSAHAATTLCGPTRYNLLTGRFAGRNARMISHTKPGEACVVLQDARLTTDDPSIGEMLHQAGYFTGFVGKWHSNFEVQAVTGEKLPGVPKNPDAPGANAQLAERERVLSKLVRTAGRFDYASRIVFGNNHGRWPITHHPEWITDGAIDFIEKAKETGKPFFVHVAHTIPHAPNNCEVLEVDPRYTLGGKLDEPPKSHPPRETIPTRLKAAGLPVSSAQVGALMLDDSVGAILKTLERLDLDRDTLVVFAQDHGMLGKGSCYSGGTHSACVMRWPAGIKPGTVVRENVSFVDFVPTFLDMAGARPPAGCRPDGVSFLPALQGRAFSRGAIYTELGVARSVVKGKYRYIAFRPTPSHIARMKDGKVKAALDTWGRLRGGDNQWYIPYKPAFFDPDQLYDREKDPLERNNLAGDPAHAEVLADLKAELKKYLDTMPTPFPLEVDPFVRTGKYAELVKARRQSCNYGNYWPGYPKLDWERYLNLNLKSPEEVDPSHRSCWHPREKGR